MILVPPTTLRRDTKNELHYSRSRLFAYYYGGEGIKRITVIEDEVIEGAWMVEAAILMEKELVEVIVYESPTDQPPS